MKNYNVRCMCSSCSIKEECEYYKCVIKPVIDIVEDSTTPQEEVFTIKLRDAIEQHYCDQYE